MSEDEGQHLQLAWDEIARVTQEFTSEEPGDMHQERFSATPYGLFSEMFRAMLARTGSDAAAEDWRRNTLRRAARKKDEGEANLDSEDETAAADAAAVAPVDAPKPDGFVPVCRRLPKGHAVATAHAEAVLLDRTRALLDLHYDAVFLAAWEAKAACSLQQAGTMQMRTEDKRLGKRRGAEERTGSTAKSSRRAWRSAISPSPCLKPSLQFFANQRTRRTGPSSSSCGRSWSMPPMVSWRRALWRRRSCRPCGTRRRQDWNQSCGAAWFSVAPSYLRAVGC